MVKPQYQNFRECYDGHFENGKFIKGEKLYELYKYCLCEECRYRQAQYRTPANGITITTPDISKVDEIAERLKSWNCADGSKQLETVYERV
ncbi:hypothetical protein D3C73_1039850 [compost metagenome]